MNDQQHAGGVPTADSFTPNARILFAALLGAIVVGVIQTTPHLAAPRGIYVGLATLVFMVSVLLALRRPLAALLLVAGGAAAAMGALDPAGPAFLAAISVVVIAARRLATSTSRAVAAMAVLAFLGAEAAGLHGLPFVELSSQSLGLFFAYVATATFADLRREQRHAAALLQEALAGRDAQVRAAALDERSRLAREMHDILAHTLAALSIQLEGARMLAEQRAGDPAVLTTLDRVSLLAREGMAEARQAVGSLRDESLPGPDRIPELVAMFERDSGIPCTMRAEGEAFDLLPEARLALYRVTQEALTNIRKHAEATAVEVVLRYAPGGVELTITNRGCPRATPLKGGGHGLLGMCERAELLGGRLEAGPMPDGYHVGLWIPR